MLEKIISGGQSGADIAGVDLAIACKIPYGGTLPAGRKCETGIVPNKYTEFTESKLDYADRTKKNVQDSDGTIVFTKGKPTGGSAFTVKYAKQCGKPCFVFDVNPMTLIVPSHVLVAGFIRDNNIKVLNVAGSRESKCPDMYHDVFDIMLKVVAELSCKV